MRCKTEVMQKKKCRIHYTECSELTATQNYREQRLYIFVYFYFPLHHDGISCGIPTCNVRMLYVTRLET